MRNKLLTLLVLILLALSLGSNFFLYRIVAQLEEKVSQIELPEQDSIETETADSTAFTPVPDSGSLVAYWDFNEGEGDTLRDLSGRGHHGYIIQGNWTDGITGKGLLLRGTGFVKIPSHPDFNIEGPLTLIAWIMPSTLEELRLTIISRASGAQEGYDMGIHTYNLLFGRVGGGSDQNKRTIIKNGALSTDVWQQVALTYDGDTAKLYVNANMVCEKLIENPTPWINSDLFIGKPADRDKMFFKGAIDEIKIFNSALSSEEIIKEFTDITNRPPAKTGDISLESGEMIETLDTEPASPPEINVSKQGLAAYYPFSRSVEDLSGNGNHATLMGPEFTSDRFGKNNGAFEFDGIDDVIMRKAPENMPGGIADRTLSGWFRSEKRIQKSAVLFGFGSPEPGKCFLAALEQYSLPHGPSVFTIEGCGENFNWKSGAGTAKYLDGKWHHIALTYDAESIILYLDGQAVGESKDYIFETSSGNISIGADLDGKGRHFTGELDDILIFNRVLEPEEIKKLANN